MAGCHEFSAVGFVSARGAAARDEARRDAVRRGGVGFAGVAERGGWRGARGWFLMHARLYPVLEKLIQAPAMLMRFSHPSQGKIYGGNSAKLRVWVIPSSSRDRLSENKQTPFPASLGPRWTFPKLVIIECSAGSKFPRWPLAVWDWSSSSIQALQSSLVIHGLARPPGPRGSGCRRGRVISGSLRLACRHDGPSDMAPV